VLEDVETVRVLPYGSKSGYVTQSSASLRKSEFNVALLQVSDLSECKYVC
jgi:hypothetical protein